MKWRQAPWNRKRNEEQLEKELRFHLDQHAADLISRGHTPDDARRLARLALGGHEQVKEGCRDVRPARWLADLFRDFRYAFRALRQNRGFAVIALLTLALGIGATTVMFTVVDGVLLRPLPYPEPERLVTVQEQTQTATQYGNLWAFAYPNFLDCKRESRTLDMAAWRYIGGTLTGNRDAEYISGLEVSAGLFSILGVPISQGRAFHPAKDLPDTPPAMIISDSLWRRRYGASPAAIGSAAVFEGRPYTIVGITSPDFRFDGSDDAELFTLLEQDQDRRLKNRQVHPGIRVWARLRPGAEIAEAQTELAGIGRRLAAGYPASNAERTFLVQSLVPNVGNVGSTLWLLLGAVVLVQLIACANIANLLLARAVSRERELAMRVALGAKRSRLVRQCLAESGVLAISGGALGVVLAAMGVKPFLAFWPGNLPRAAEIHMDWRILLFALAASLLSGLIFGLAPVARTSARALEQTLRIGGRATSGSHRLHSAFVLSEIALAVVLLVAAGMLGRTLLRISSLDPGMNVRDVLVARLALSPGVRSNPEQLRISWQDVIDRARRVPGVKAVALVDTVPMRAGNNQLGYWSTPEEPPLNQMPLALATSTTPDYLKVMGIPLLRGRYFDERDRPGSELVVVIDEVLAQRAFGGSDPVGRHLWIKAEPWTTAGPAKVAGMVRHVRHWGLADDDQSDVRAQIYYPFAQVPDSLLGFFSTLMSVGVRTSIPPLNALESLRRETLGTTGSEVLYEVRTMDQLAGDTLARQQFLLLSFAMFAGIALLLACGGIYGLLAYLTSQRVPEIGVRMALGANAGQVIRLVLRQSMGMVLAGITLGTVGAIAAGQLLERFVAGVEATEPLTFVVMLPLMVAAALFASFLPARRASRTDPVRVLRQE